jgi:hypothetical protein
VTAEHTPIRRHETVVDAEIARLGGVAARAAQVYDYARKADDGERGYTSYGRPSVDEARAALDAAWREHDLYVAEHYTGWARFFLVTNNNGHIHSSTSCSTCYPDTGFAWLTELSGLAAPEAVAEYGEILCSVCFPSAPVEWTRGENKKVAAERELHRALTEIARSPEGKAVKRAEDLVRSKKYRIDTAERAITRHREYVERDSANFDATVPLWVVEKAAQADKDLPKLHKQLASAERKLASAQAALVAALQPGEVDLA